MAKRRTRRASFKNPIPVLPYQERWIEDNSLLKIAVWSRQSGKSFAAALRAVLKCSDTRTQYIVLSKGERQSRLFMEKVKDFCQAFKDLKMLSEFEAGPESAEKTMEVFFPDTGSRIIGLPANPDTARGYSGHIVLDEFAFHGDAHKIFAACFPIITRGYSIEVISTPNGTAGKFYEIAKAAGLVGPGTRDSGLGKTPAPSPQPPAPSSGPATKLTSTTPLPRGFRRTSSSFAPVATMKRPGCKSTAASSSPTRKITFPWS